MEFPTPQLADPDIGLVDLQMLDAFSTQDFSDLLGPFDMAAMDYSGGDQGPVVDRGWV